MNNYHQILIAIMITKQSLSFINFISFCFKVLVIYLYQIDPLQTHQLLFVLLSMINSLMILFLFIL